MIRPCPTCDAPAGFHTDDKHREARGAIPGHLLRPLSEKRAK